MRGQFLRVGLAALCGVVFLGEGAVASVVRLGANDTTHERRLALTQGRETGGLTEESDTLESDGSYFAVHRFEGVAGEVVSIQLTSEEFDTYLLLIDPNGNLIAEDDDGLGGTNSRIVIELPMSGTYSLVVNSYEAGAIGRYEVSWQTGGQTAQGFDSLFDEGRQFFNLGTAEGYREAIARFEAALAIAERVNANDGIALASFFLGVSNSNLGNQQAALSHYQTALVGFRAAGDRAEEAITLNDIGLVYSSLGQKSEALRYYEQALSIHRDVGDRAEEATTLNNIGGVYSSLGQKSEALRYFEQALLIRREVGDRAGEAGTLNNIGHVYADLGQKSEALRYYEQALPTFREVGDRAGEATILSNIGSVYLDLGQKSEALRYFEQALPIRREVGDRAGEATILNNIGGVYDSLGQKSEALRYYEQALPISREVGDRAGESATLNNIGSVYYSLEQKSEALRYFEQVLPISREVGDRAGEASTLHNMASVYRTQNNLPTALTNIETAIAIVEQLRSEITSTDLRTSYFATVQYYYQLQIDILMQLHQQNPESGYDIRAFNASERTRARTLIELLAEANLDITENIDPELRNRERDLRQQLQTLDAQRVAQLQAVTDNSQIEAIIEEFDNQTTQVLRELDILAAKLRQTNPAYAAIQYPEPLELAGVQQQVLDPDTTLLQYSLGDDYSYLWVVNQDGFESYTLPGRTEIETAAHEFYGSVDRLSGASDITRKAQALSDLILAPVADRLTTDRLLIVPDGNLHQIPFSAIATPGADTYEPLLVNYEIVNAPSSTVIAINRDTMGDRPPAPNRLAVLADPVFTTDDQRLTGHSATDSIDPNGVSYLSRALRAFDLRNIPRLPSTKTEADRILELADGNETAVFGFDANYSWVANNTASRYQFVHFATHGFANSEDPELSGLVLSLLDASGNPQNGFLRLADIFNLQLPAEMVVLSACQTGLGENVGGEGIVGLTRGLMYAGAERTVLSLWNVSDAKTADLMVQFYRSIWDEGLTPVAALRQAQLEMWDAGEHPHFWAAFGVQGEWRD